MWLTLDIGNSAAKGGFFEGDRLAETFRIAREAPPDAWEGALAEHLRRRAVTRAGVASVVPAATALVRPLLERLAGVPVEVLDYRMRLPFALAYETPQTMGTDRLAAAAAAWVRFGQPADGGPRSVVALDAGTAVTYEVVDRTGVFLGGTIAAGPALLRDALRRGTAQLPAVPLELPETPVGRSTQEALQAGILFAFLDGVRGMLARVREALGEAPLVVATGGWGAFLQSHLDEIDLVEPHLVLHGIRVLMALNDPDA